MSRAFSDSEITKLKQIINEGIQVTSELETLKGGLSDTVKAIAEELDMKPATINKAIRIAYKNEFAKVQEGFEEVETVLAAIGKDH
jgi:DNA-binding MarR family transcriptional regulator|tara:strand:+ start:2678 stop:2935 length:258 start_codon:yes stop_codon:yes gene_type:complete